MPGEKDVIAKIAFCVATVVPRDTPMELYKFSGADSTYFSSLFVRGVRDANTTPLSLFEETNPVPSSLRSQ